jgi:transposase
MKNENIDARKVNTQTQQEKRNIAMKLRDKGIKNSEVANIVGVHHCTVSQWYSKYKKDKKSIIVGKRGRDKGAGAKLSQEQEQQIIRLLIDKNPQQLQFKFALWTREAVRQLIKQEIKIELPISTVGDYLKRWKFTSKKPIKRAYERKDEKTKQWLEVEYPKIKKEAKKDNADIWWADETACVSLPTNLKGYAPIGSKNKPILKHPARKFKINMISAITNTGKTMFSLYDESVNIEKFIDFLQKVIDSSDKKVYIIVDNLRVHHAKLVTAWIEEHKDKIAIFYLPPYSPDYNPDEYLNQDYKRNANKNRIPINLKELRENTENYMNNLVKDTEKVANFFKHPSIVYAA